MDDLKYWVAFTRIPRIGTARVRLLERTFGTLEQAWTSSADQLKAAGLDEATVAVVATRRPQVDPDAEMEHLKERGIQALSWHHPSYPPLLKEIYDPPPVLFVQGSILAADGRAVAVVGTRRATAYGREAAEALVGDLARAGVTIISGLARGIDAVAHRAALAAGGRTIAILGSGLDTIYPPEHRGLAQEIPHAGALVSEHPLGVRPEAQHFPRRNRLLSGMALGVLVLEAPPDSGAMWTVKWALEQGRDVFAVPGSIFSPASQGTNRLIQEGAKLVAECKDVLEELNLAGVGYQPELPSLARVPVPDDAEAQLLEWVGPDPVHIDDVRRRSGLPIATVSSTLAMMEIKGLVKQVGGMHYVRAREVSAPYRPTP
ncbi:MAG: DNA-protecting protein DprA [Chloroflexi bacterium]|nr:DNA-protecting protein DprA [Chloroflexota bacterium]